MKRNCGGSIARLLCYYFEFLHLFIFAHTIGGPTQINWNRGKMRHARRERRAHNGKWISSKQFFCIAHSNLPSHNCSNTISQIVVLCSRYVWSFFSYLFAVFSPDIQWIGNSETMANKSNIYMPFEFYEILSIKSDGKNE